MFCTIIRFILTSKHRVHFIHISRNHQNCFKNKFQIKAIMTRKYQYMLRVIDLQLIFLSMMPQVTLSFIYTVAHILQLKLRFCGRKTVWWNFQKPTHLLVKDVLILKLDFFQNDQLDFFHQAHQQQFYTCNLFGYKMLHYVLCSLYLISRGCLKLAFYITWHIFRQDFLQHYVLQFLR